MLFECHTVGILPLFAWEKYNDEANALQKKFDDIILAVTTQCASVSDARPL